MYILLIGCKSVWGEEKTSGQNTLDTTQHVHREKARAGAPAARSPAVRPLLNYGEEKKTVRIFFVTFAKNEKFQ